MTTELVLLLGLFAFVSGGLFFSEKGPIGVFEKSGPRLAARIEQHVTIGREFKVKSSEVQKWKAPGKPAPTGRL